MRVLVTAKNGQLGWELQQTLMAAQDDGEHWAVQADARFFDSTELDITDTGAVKKELNAFEPHIVINAAAYTAVDKAESDVGAAYAVNEKGPANLAAVCKEIQAKLIHISTDFVFDATKNTPYLPEDHTRPSGVYGASKFAGEQQVQRILGDNACIVRTAWVYSVHGNNFVKTMLRLMAEKEQLGVVTDQIGTPTSARGLAQAIWHLAGQFVAQGKTTQRIYHWTDLGTASWYDFAIAIQELALQTGLLQQTIPVNPIRTCQYPTPAKRPAYSVMDSSALRDELALSGLHWRKALSLVINEMAREVIENNPVRQSIKESNL